jgi:hypothetical protein
MAAAVVFLPVNPATRFPFSFSSGVTITDSSMTVISTMVQRGDLWGATARVGSSYRFDQPAGLVALRRFSVLVLRRRLDYDPYERCYATSALATAGDRDEIVGDGLGSRGTTVEVFTRKAKQVCTRRTPGPGNRPA